LSTGSIDMRTSQLEGGEIVIKGSWLPGRSGVTGCAVRAVLAAVTIIGCMASVTGCRRTLEYTVYMALGTSCTGMCTGQWEGRFGMIERGWLPS
jgi:hypothetical protein